MNPLLEAILLVGGIAVLVPPATLLYFKYVNMMGTLILS